jgi:hypothetical protein
MLLEGALQVLVREVALGVLAQVAEVGNVVSRR